MVALMDDLKAAKAAFSSVYWRVDATADWKVCEWADHWVSS
jgi:hypothetical protein